MRHTPCECASLVSFLLFCVALYAYGQHDPAHACGCPVSWVCNVDKKDSVQNFICQTTSRARITFAMRAAIKKGILLIEIITQIAAYTRASAKTAMNRMDNKLGRIRYSICTQVSMHAIVPSNTMYGRNPLNLYGTVLYNWKAWSFTHPVGIACRNCFRRLHNISSCGMSKIIIYLKPICPPLIQANSDQIYYALLHQATHTQQ